MAFGRITTLNNFHPLQLFTMHNRSKLPFSLWITCICSHIPQVHPQAVGELVARHYM